MFLPGGAGGSLMKNLFASSRVLGTTTNGFLAPVGSLVRLEARDKGMPPPLTEAVLLLAGGGSSTESGVRGES